MADDLHMVLPRRHGPLEIRPAEQSVGELVLAGERAVVGVASRSFPPLIRPARVEHRVRGAGHPGAPFFLFLGHGVQALLDVCVFHVTFDTVFFFFLRLFGLAWRCVGG